MTPPEDVANLLTAIPLGTAKGSAQGKRYITTRSLFNIGKSTRLVAEERGGSDYISLNFYDLSKGAQLYPCEMPGAMVIAFQRSFQPDLAS